MGLFDRLFGISTKKETQPDIHFGRYSDAYKSPNQYKAWDDSMEEFDNKSFLNAYEQFFAYLKDPSQENVTIKMQNDDLHFEILQGSKKIVGIANNERVVASSNIVKFDKTNVGFMRQLLDKNYTLKFCRYSLTEDSFINIKFDTSVVDGSPLKLYHAIKELALNADKQDDLLANQFSMLHSVNDSHIKELPKEEKATKHQYTISEINSVLNQLKDEKLDVNKFSAGISYLLLHLCYKLDYLIKPEGYMMEALERIHSGYFAKSAGQDGVQKNLLLQKGLEKLLERSEEDLSKELYRVTSTFGVTNSCGHDRIVAFINGELKNMDWYLKNNHNKIALAIPGYIAGYCTFFYAPPQPDREFFHLFFEITESRYFKDLGFSFDYYDYEKDSLNKSAIKREIKDIASSNKDKYPKLSPNLSVLNFDSLPEFARTYMLMILELNLQPKSE